MTDESTVLNNLRTAHIGDWGVDLSSQEVHELWADIEAKEIISSCMQILSSQEVHELWADIEAMKKRLAYLEAERIVEWVFEDQLPDGIPDAVYSAMYACSKVDFVRVFPAVTVDGRKRFLIELPGA